jgi:hypothetical protein
VRRDQDHFGAAALAVLSQQPGQLKTALFSEADVGQDDVRP